MQNDSFYSVQHWSYEVSIPLFIYYFYLIPNTISFRRPIYINLLGLCLPNLGIQFSLQKTLFYSFCSQSHRKKIPARSDMPKTINILSVSSNLMSVVKQLITKSEKQKGVNSFAHDADCHSHPRCLSGRMLQ